MCSKPYGIILQTSHLFISYLFLLCVLYFTLVFDFGTTGMPVVHRGQRGHQTDPLELELQRVVNCHIGMGTKPGPLQDQQVLQATEPPFQSLIAVLIGPHQDLWREQVRAQCGDTPLIPEVRRQGRQISGQPGLFT